MTLVLGSNGKPKEFRLAYWEILSLQLVDMSVSQRLDILISSRIQDMCFVMDANTGFPKTNAPTLQCHIFKNIEFDVFTFFTVI